MLRKTNGGNLNDDHHANAQTHECSDNLLAHFAKMGCFLFHMAPLSDIIALAQQLWVAIKVQNKELFAPSTIWWPLSKGENIYSLLHFTLEWSIKNLGVVN